MKIPPIFLALITITYSHAGGGSLSGRQSECALAVQAEKFVASFPVKNPKQNTWTWHHEKKTPDGIDYSWTVELGRIEKGLFKANRIAFGLGHRSEYERVGDRSGQLKDFLSIIGGDGTLYLNSDNKKERANFDPKLSSFRINGAYVSGEVILYSRSHNVVTVLFSNAPTHAKMKMMTPYGEQNYSCLAKINYQ